MSVDSDYQEVVDHYAGYPARGVSLDLPVINLLNLRQLEHLESFIKRVGASCWERFVATPQLWQQLPAREGGIYMFCWAPRFSLSLEDGAAAFRYVMYVGKTGMGPNASFRQRYRGEYAKILHGNPGVHWRPPEAVDGRAQKLRQHLNLFPLEYWILPCASEHVDYIETSLIKVFNPPANTQNRVARARVSSTRPAF